MKITTEIKTPKGIINIEEADSDLIKNLQQLLTFGVIPFGKPVNGAHFGIVMQCGKEEVYCIKQQTIDIDRKQAEYLCQVQHLMIMEAYLQYLKIGFKGAYLASPYLKQKGNGLWESGVAHFIFPSEQEPGYSNASFSKAYDKKFGDGATNMFLAFMESYKQAFIEAKMRMPHYLGFDVRTRSDIQNLAMYFMAFGSDILCLRANLREKDVAWQILAKSGINKVYHLPAVPMTINELDLDIAKGRIQ